MYLMDLMDPSNRGQTLDEEEKQAVIELLANKLAKNPVFTGREQQVKKLIGIKTGVIILFTAYAGIWAMVGFHWCLLQGEVTIDVQENLEASQQEIEEMNCSNDEMLMFD